MKSMRDVWILTVGIAVASAALWGTFWASSGADMQSGRLGDAMLGVWVIFTQKGSMMWLPYLLAALAAGGIAFALGMSSLRSREAAEARAATVAERPHPMD